MSLPDKFKFTNVFGDSCHAERVGGNYRIHNEGSYVCSASQYEVEAFLFNKVWALIEEENKDVMEIPVKFTMGLQEDQIPLYVLTLQEGGMYSCVSTKDDKYSFGPYNLNTVEGWLNGGVFTMTEDLSNNSNGVDADGNPTKNFTKENLKPFMRVVLENGYEYIVVPNKEYGVVGSNPDTGWMHMALTDKEAEDAVISSEWLIKYVYDAPYYAADMLEVSCFGELLWQRNEVEVEVEVANQLAVNPFQDRIDYFEVSIQALRDELEALKEDMGI